MMFPQSVNHNAIGLGRQCHVTHSLLVKRGDYNETKE